MKKTIKIILILFISHISIGQNYLGDIHTVSKDGLYQILLSPEVRSLSKNNLNYVRIYDSTNKEIPYANTKDYFIESNFENFQIISRTRNNNLATSVVILNENSRLIDELVLEIANSNISKKYNISGSNDNKEWFGLVYNKTVDNLFEKGEISVKHSFSFPLNDYKYIKFDFKDEDSLPIQVIRAGLQKNTSKTNTWINVTGFKQIITTDSKKKQTKIVINFETPQVIDGIKFDIKSPNFYLRKTRIYIEKTQKVKKKEQIIQETIATFDLDNKKSNSFNISNIFTNQIIIEINNADNLPLDIAEIELFQNQESLIIDLKADQQYYIHIADTFRAPIYDLEKSGIDLNKKYPETTIYNLEKKTINKEKAENTLFWQTSYFMWICISIAVVILGYFAISMVKDVDKKEKE